MAVQNRFPDYAINKSALEAAQRHAEVFRPVHVSVTDLLSNARLIRAYLREPAVTEEDAPAVSPKSAVDRWAEGPGMIAALLPRPGVVDHDEVPPPSVEAPASPATAEVVAGPTAQKKLSHWKPASLEGDSNGTKRRRAIKAMLEADVPMPAIAAATGSALKTVRRLAWEFRSAAKAPAPPAQAAYARSVKAEKAVERASTAAPSNGAVLPQRRRMQRVVEREELVRTFTTAGVPVWKIADEIGLTVSAVGAIRRRLGIGERRRSSEEALAKIRVNAVRARQAGAAKRAARQAAAQASV